MAVNQIMELPAAFASGRIIYLFIRFGLFLIPFMRWDSSIGIATGYVLDDRGSIPSKNRPACSFKTSVAAYKFTHCHKPEFHNLNNYADSNKNKKFLEELIAYFPFTRHGPLRKQKIYIKSGTQTARRSHKLPFISSKYKK
jgi:hypothetical protein